MFRTTTRSKSFLTSMVAATALVLASSASAKPPEDGKVRPGQPGTANIVEIALAVNADLGEFDYLLGAVGCLTDEEGNNAVIDLLTGEDKYTLFAPTDAAFEALQAALGIAVPSPELTCAVDDLFGEGTLLTVLAYHVTDGRRFSNSLFNANNDKAVEMLVGGYITTTPDFYIIDNVDQMIGLVPPFININASNGVVHVIDTVMLPVDPSTL